MVKRPCIPDVLHGAQIPSLDRLSSILAAHYLYFNLSLPFIFLFSLNHLLLPPFVQSYFLMVLLTLIDLLHFTNAITSQLTTSLKTL